MKQQFHSRTLVVTEAQQTVNMQHGTTLTHHQQRLDLITRLPAGEVVEYLERERSMDLCFYWINLNKDIGRRQHMENLFAKYIIKNKRISAILGHGSEKNKVVACTKSHLKAIQTFLELPVVGTNSNIAIICEDDLSFDYEKYWIYHKDWDLNIKQIIKNAPNDWEIIQLRLYVDKLDSDFYNLDTDYIPHKFNYFSCGCYLINRQAAEKIVKLGVKTNGKQIDYTSDCILFSVLKTYTFKYPMFTARDNNNSTIHPNHLKFQENSKNIIYEFLKNKSILNNGKFL